MIIDDEISAIEKIKNILKDQDTNIINVTNSRQAIDKLNKEIKIDLILLNTKLNDENTRSYISMKPNSDLSTLIDDECNILQKPFTDEEFKKFFLNKF